MIDQYVFWHYTGTAYEAKRNHFTGKRIPTMDFSIHTQDGDVHVELIGYDFPIRDGHEVTVVCARGKDVKQGHVVHFINKRLRVSATMTSLRNELPKKAGFLAAAYDCKMN